jgi:peptidoglycan/xylan/chitin deacetylase (PgdA/CDA1 family)
LTDTSGAWLGLSHGLKSIGVPFLITTDYRQAIKHSVILVYPMVSGKVLSAEALKALAVVPRQGGTLIGFNVLGGGLNEVFGFGEAVPSGQHYQIQFSRSHPLASSFIDANESVIRIANHRSKEVAGSHSYTDPEAEPLAVYEDGAAAITHRSYDTGRAYAFGLDLGFLLQTGYSNREEGIARSYVNEYEPALDVLLRLVEGIYRNGQRSAVTLATVPWDKSLAVMITHDVDYTQSVLNSLPYADFEQSQGIRATYFIQTKYIRDFNDAVFLNEQGVALLRELASRNIEVASHSVSHSPIFHRFPVGSGREEYPSYRPHVVDPVKTRDGSLLGELRVSKFLLEKLLGRGEVFSFRPGHLSNPYGLPEALVATGYRFSSSVTANNSLTHLPFQLNYARAQLTEVEIFEFPVTIEDEALPPLGERLPQAIDLARKLSRYGGSCVVLIHTNTLGQKFGFERDFTNAVRDFSWFGTLSEFGQWWAARNKVGVDVERGAEHWTVHLDIPEPLVGLTLQVPSSFQFQASNPADLGVTQKQARVLVPKAEGEIDLIFKERSGGTATTAESVSTAGG